MYLDELLPGDKATIVKIEDTGHLKKRLVELGIREGKELLVRRNAPLGDPIEIYIMGLNISLRKNEAKHIKVEKIN